MDSEKRARDRAWIAKRKAEGIQILGGQCITCGTTEDLEIDHINPDTKDPRLRKNNHGFPWTWNWEWILSELAKCQLLCRKHHLEKGLDNQEFGKGYPGASNPRAKLSEQDAIAIRSSLLSSKELATIYNVHPATINKIRRGARWSNLASSHRTLNGTYAKTRLEPPASPHPDPASPENEIRGER